MKIETWMLSQFVLRYFGGSVDGERIEPGIYRFTGENGKQVVIAQGGDAADARRRVTRYVARITETADGRITHAAQD